MVVDDEERILNFLRSKLKASGYEIFTAANGLEALELAQAQEPDLILLDVIMPKMDGFDTLKELRKFSTVPVIILSARDADFDKIKGFKLGADDYLQKPFNPDELVARIEAVRRRLEPSMTGMTGVDSSWMARCWAWMISCCKRSRSSSAVLRSVMSIEMPRMRRATPSWSTIGRLVA